jgi:hypothetical protein
MRHTSGLLTIYLASVALWLAVIVCAPRAATAQTPVGEWTLSGEAAGVLGGTWLKGTRAPNVSAGPGAELSLRTVYATSSRLGVGAALRVASQSLRADELDARWDAGTISTAQLLGLASVALSSRSQWPVHLDLGVGGVALSGARALFPFSASSRIAPAFEAGVGIRHDAGDATSATAPRRRSLIGQTGVFVRYNVIRFDPGSAAAGTGGAAGSAGWVGRVVLGLRIDR